MRVALLTDIHGNAAALEAVLRDARQHKPDLYLFGGDLTVNGPRPQEALAQVTELGAPSVRGNMDDELVKSDDPICAWTRACLDAEGIAFVAKLPLSKRITPPDGISPRDDLLVVHSTPRSNTDLLILKPAGETTSFKEATPTEAAEAMLTGTVANRVVYGHIHYFSDGTVGGLRVGSIGSVGFPFDGDPRAAYALADWDERGWQIQPVRVSYDYESVARDIEQSGQPSPERYAAMIRKARWLPKES